MSRPIVLLSLTQALAVVLGFYGLSIVLRHYGYPGGPPQGISSFVIYQWSPLTLFLRRYGFILLLIPLAWATLTAMSDRRGRIIFPFWLWMILGTIAPVIIIATFFYAIVHPSIAVPN